MSQRSGWQSTQCSRSRCAVLGRGGWPAGVRSAGSPGSSHTSLAAAHVRLTMPENTAGHGRPAEFAAAAGHVHQPAHPAAHPVPAPQGSDPQHPPQASPAAAVAPQLRVRSLQQRAPPAAQPSSHALPLSCWDGVALQARHSVGPYRTSPPPRPGRQAGLHAQLCVSMWLDSCGPAAPAALPLPCCSGICSALG